MSAPSAPQLAFSHAERTTATMVGRRAPAGSMMPIVVMGVGTLVIVGAIVFLLMNREPEVKAIDFASAFACPQGSESRSVRVRVTANTLNVRAGPNSRADRMPDRTLRKDVAVTEECRSATWSRVRLADGRSGWVANQYLRPISRTN